MVLPFRVRARVVGLGFLLALACVPEAEDVADSDGSSGSEVDTSTSGTETDSGETDDTDAGEGVCYNETSTTEFPGPITCMLDSPCPTVEFAFKAFECTSADYDPAAAACIIDALRTGTPSVHRMQDCGGAKYNVETRLQIFDDGTVLWYQQRNTCGEPQSYRETLRSLPGPGYFDGCDITTGAGFGACIDGIILQPCVLHQPSCP